MNQEELLRREEYAKQKLIENNFEPTFSHRRIFLLGMDNKPNDLTTNLNLMYGIMISLNTETELNLCQVLLSGMGIRSEIIGDGDERAVVAEVTFYQINKVISNINEKYKGWYITVRDNPKVEIND